MQTGRKESLEFHENNLGDVREKWRLATNPLFHSEKQKGYLLEGKQKIVAQWGTHEGRPTVLEHIEDNST